MGISQLDRAVHSLANAGLSPATISSYKSGVNRYLAFCTKYDFLPFPLKSPDSEYQFSDFLPCLERTTNGDAVFTLKMGGPIEKFRVKLNSF